MSSSSGSVPRCVRASRGSTSIRSWGDVGGDHLQPILETILTRIGGLTQVTELGDALGLEQVAHPAFEIGAGVQALVRKHVDALADRKMVAILELPELHLLQHETLQLVPRVTCGDERGSDRARGPSRPPAEAGIPVRRGS